MASRWLETGYAGRHLTMALGSGVVHPSEHRPPRHAAGRSRRQTRARARLRKPSECNRALSCAVCAPPRAPSYSYGVWTLWCETPEVPPNAGSLLRLPPLLDGDNLCDSSIVPVKTRGQSEQRSGIGRDLQ